MKFQVGVFAFFEEKYGQWTDDGRWSMREVITHKVHDWCDENGIEWHKKEGKTLVHIHEFELDLDTRREDVVRGMVEGLRAKQTEIRAEATAQITSIDGKINRLLALEYVPAAEEDLGEFAPVRRPGSKDADVTDVMDARTAFGDPDNIPF